MMNSVSGSATIPQSDSERQFVLRFLARHPQAAVRVLEQYPSAQIVELLQGLDAALVGPLVELMLPETVARLCQLLTAEQMTVWLSGLTARRMTLVLWQMKKSQQKIVLDALPMQTATACQMLLNYPQDAVGAWMSGRFAVLPNNISMAEALQRLRNSENILDSDAIPVIDTGQHLQGLVTYADLLAATPTAMLNEWLQGQSVQHNAPVLSARASLDMARQHDGWRQYDVLPVLDREQRLVGMLRHVHLRDALERRILQTENQGSVQPASILTNVGRSYLQVLGGSLGWLTDIGGSAGTVSESNARKI